MSRGGRRDGAGRPKGSLWKPATAAFRADAVERCAAIVNEQDPLSVVAAMVLDTSLGIGIRLSAANTCLPYLYPKLSSSSVDARVTHMKIDSTDLVKRLDDMIARTVPATAAPVIEAPPVQVTIDVDDDPDLSLGRGDAIGDTPE